MCATKQRSGHDPGEISHAEPQWTDNDRDGADVRQVRSDFKMIMAKRKPGGGADILHGEGYGETDRKQDRRIPPAIE